MNKINLISYYHFGTCLRFLQDAKAGYQIAGDGFIQSNIKWLLAYFDQFGLLVTKRVAWKLNKLQEDLEAAVSLDEKAILSTEHAGKLAQSMSEIRIALDAEMQGFAAYVISPMRIDVNKLLDDVPSLFAPEVFTSLPEVARYDFMEAGKCLAFERPTAAAFHLVRGTEATLRHFYCSLIKQKRVKVLLWGAMVVDLRVRQKTKEYQALYNHLDNIRVAFRNPTQHPEAIYDIHEAQDLWALCTEVVNRMMKILASS